MRRSQTPKPLILGSNTMLRECSNGIREKERASERACVEELGVHTNVEEDFPSLCVKLGVWDPPCMCHTDCHAEEETENARQVARRRHAL